MALTVTSVVGGGAPRHSLSATLSVTLPPLPCRDRLCRGEAAGDHKLQPKRYKVPRKEALMSVSWSRLSGRTTAILLMHSSVYIVGDGSDGRHCGAAGGKSGVSGNRKVAGSIPGLPLAKCRGVPEQDTT